MSYSSSTHDAFRREINLLHSLRQLRRRFCFTSTILHEVEGILHPVATTALAK